MSTSPTTPTTQRFTVEGMSCGHCATSVRNEVSQVQGVQDVQVDLASGHVVVVGTDVRDEAVAAAVAEAGYAVAP